MSTNMKAKVKCQDLGVEIWRIDQYTTTTLSVSNESADLLDDPEKLKEVTEIIAEANGVHPSWVEYDSSVPEFKIKLESCVFTKY